MHHLLRALNANSACLCFAICAFSIGELSIVAHQHLRNVFCIARDAFFHHRLEQSMGPFVARLHGSSRDRRVGSPCFLDCLVRLLSAICQGALLWRRHGIEMGIGMAAGEFLRSSPRPPGLHAQTNSAGAGRLCCGTGIRPVTPYSPSGKRYAEQGYPQHPSRTRRST